MEFNKQLLREYKNMQETTSIQESYQQVILLIKYIKSRPEEE